MAQQQGVHFSIQKGVNKTALKKLDYTKMRLQIPSNPLEYLVRFDDEKSYHGVVFDKNYKKIDSIDLE